MPTSTSTSTPVSAPVSPPGSVTVIGLGPMGRALARSFVAAGVRTTVWNRTPGKDEELIALGAVRAATAADAVAASEVTVVCVVNYDASDAVLRDDPVATALKGRTLVNLTADTPDRARDTARWAEAHGIRYLDGAIMTPTVTIGTPDAVFILSGPEELHLAHLDLLGKLGGTLTHLGEDIGRAAAFDIALLDIYWTAMSGYSHALALASAEGISARELLPFALGIGAILPPSFEDGAAAADDDDHSGEANPISSAASSMAHVVHASEAHGIDASLMRAAEGLARRVMGRGHGADGFSRMTELLRRG